MYTSIIILEQQTAVPTVEIILAEETLPGTPTVRSSAPSVAASPGAVPLATDACRAALPAAPVVAPPIGVPVGLPPSA